MSRLLFNPKTNRLLATSTGLRHSHSDTCTCCFCKGFDCTPIADCPAATPGSWKVEASGITLGGTFEGSGGGYGNVPLPDHTIAFSGDTTFAGEGSALQFGAAGFNACAWAGIIPTPIKLAITAAMALDANQDPLTYTTSWTVEPSVSVNFAARQNEEDEWVGVMEVSFRITKYAEGHDLNPSGPDESTYLVANLLVFRGEFTPSCDTQEIVVANELTAGEWSSTQFSIRERQYTYHIGSGGTIKLTPCRASGQCGEGACCERYDAYFSNVTRRRVYWRDWWQHVWSLVHVGEDEPAGNLSGFGYPALYCDAVNRRWLLATWVASGPQYTHNEPGEDGPNETDQFRFWKPAAHLLFASPISGNPAHNCPPTSTEAWTLVGSSYMPLDTALVSLSCDMGQCPTNCDECCSRYRIKITGTTAPITGIWIIDRAGCQWSGGDGTVSISLTCTDGYWYLQVGNGTCTIRWRARVLPAAGGCPPIWDTVWVIDSAEGCGAGNSTLEIRGHECDLEDCPSDCEECCKYVVTATGAINEQWTLVRSSGCQWLFEDPDYVVSLRCEDKYWLLEIQSVIGDCIIHWRTPNLPSGDGCPPHEAEWELVSSTCGEVAIGVERDCDWPCPADCNNCCEELTVTLSDSDCPLLNGPYVAFRTGPDSCTWIYSDEFTEITITCESANNRWRMDATHDDGAMGVCAYVFYRDTNTVGCVPEGPWTPDGSNGDAAAVTVECA